MRPSPVSLKNVTINDAFWAPRIRQMREITIPYQWEVMNDRVPGAAKSGAVMNFKIAAGKAQGDFYGAPWQDSDLGKWIEGVAYSLAAHPDKKLEKLADGMIDLIAASQDRNGYLNTAFTLKDRDKRWTNLMMWHELYVMGHLMEGAVAYYQATGKRKFMDVMARCAGHIATVLGREEGKKRGYCGHEEIELALVKLYRTTGEKKYLNLARYFIDERGRKPSYFDAEYKALGSQGWHPDPAYFQAHKPVREQTEAVGHCVRAMYLYSAMADIAAETGDKGLLAACKRLWKDVLEHKLYVIGSIGSSGSAGEAFTLDYELPNETAYTETCAAIGLVFWAHRMLALDVNSTYADVMERALYNGILSGVSWDGTLFFYSNPLAAYPGSGVEGIRASRRPKWHGCACCPPNLLRLLTSLGGYMYSRTPREAFVHLYAGGEAALDVAGQTVRIEQKTSYPWGETVTLAVRPERPASFTLSLRIPGWCKCGAGRRGAKLKLNGKTLNIGSLLKNGYARITRKWRKGDKVTLTLPMPVERVYSHPSIRHDVGRVALQRGPVVYCLEEADNGSDLNAVALPRTARLTARIDRKLFGGVPVITSRATRLARNSTGLYPTEPPRTVSAPIKAIPYFLWANRDEGEMIVWIRET